MKHCEGNRGGHVSRGGVRELTQSATHLGRQGGGHGTIESPPLYVVLITCLISRGDRHSQDIRRVHLKRLEKFARAPRSGRSPTLQMGWKKVSHKTKEYVPVRGERMASKGRGLESLQEYARLRQVVGRISTGMVAVFAPQLGTETLQENPEPGRGVRGYTPNKVKSGSVRSHSLQSFAWAPHTSRRAILLIDLILS